MGQISKLANREQGTDRPVSGQGMDRVVARRRTWSSRYGLVAAGLAVLGLAGWYVSTLMAGSSLSVDGSRLQISTAEVGTFEDFIPLRGRLVPRSTVYLDAIEGGRVEEVLVEDGALVEAGQAIALLSNTNLQLEVLGREAAVTEQLNNMRTLELQLEQNRLSHRRNLVEIEYQIKRLTSAVERQDALARDQLVSQSTLDDLRDELAYYQARRQVTLDSQATDARLQEEQLRQLRSAGQQLESSLALARRNLEDLNIRAPLAGKLSGFTVEIGESIAPGGRLGQIDDPDSFKLKASIDEYYLGRVDLQQAATTVHNGDSLELSVSKIYPQVNNGQFEVDLAFAGEPTGLRRGQTLQLKLSLGDNADALLIPNGSFYQDTGGSWLFVVSEDGSEARRRPVRLGRRNVDYIEVLEGLKPGERVITSPYTRFMDMDRLTLATE